MEGLNGYILLYRKLIKWGWYRDSVVKDLFLHILLTASYVPFDYCGEKYPAGTLITNIKNLADDLGFSTQQIRTAIQKLRSTSEICVKSTNKFTSINIVKWGDYQVSTLFDQQTNNKQITNEQQTNNKQNGYTYKEKNKKIKNKEYIFARTRAREKKQNDFGAFDLDLFEDKLREG